MNNRDSYNNQLSTKNSHYNNSIFDKSPNHLGDGASSQFPTSNFQSQSVLPRASHFAQQESNFSNRDGSLNVPQNPLEKKVGSSNQSHLKSLSPNPNVLSKPNNSIFNLPLVGTESMMSNR